MLYMSGMAIRIVDVKELIPHDVTWCSYLVLHPKTRVPLYAGMTSDIASRRVAHCGPQSKVRKFLADNGEEELPITVVVGKFKTRDEALDHELLLIDQYPNLLNKTAQRCGGRNLWFEPSIEAEKPWEKLNPPVSRRTWYRRQKAKPE